MKTRAMVAVSALAAGLAACSDYNKDEASYDAGNNAAYAEGQGGNYAAGSASGYGTSSNWPAGSRIVVENGTTYRIGPDGVRVALTPSDSRIVVENGVRFRVDPSGTRVRIDPSGADISVGPDGVAVPVSGTTTVNVTTNRQ